MADILRLNRKFIRVLGPDARGFLDNLLTQSLDKRAIGSLAYGALLSPQGKLIADMLIWPRANDFILEIDPTRADDLLRRLSMYKLRANVVMSEAADLVCAWSREAFEGASDDPRLAMLGARKLIKHAEAEGFPDGTRVHEAHRLALGVPDLARDADPDEVFGLEALLEELQGVDFQKGCFVGQENVSRMKRRATTRKKFCPITFNGETIPSGTVITAGEAEIGTVRSGGPGRAIALLRLDRARTAGGANTALRASQRPIQLDPPPWLILPGAAGESD